jgi:NADH:ubiquinone oxidoreductase subunit
MTDTFDPTKDKDVHLTGLFFCHPCHTIDEIPGYEPDKADYDARIDHIYLSHIRRHPSTEDRFILEWAALAFVPTRHWKDPEYNKQIKTKLLEGMGKGGFDQNFYDTQNTFKADAMECYKRHGNPAYKSNTQPKCTDYLDHKMEIKPNTNAERKKAGLPTYDETKAKRSFICEYCPYHQSVITETRKM